MPQDSGEQNKKPPERADALRIDLPFEDALDAALRVKPPKTEKKKKVRKRQE